jgi:hypothetical protein
MVIRFPSPPARPNRLETQPPDPAGARPLSRREIEHRERMLEHLARVARQTARAS